MTHARGINPQPEPEECEELDISKLSQEELERELRKRRNEPMLTSTAGTFPDNPGEVSEMPDLPRIERKVPEAKEKRQEMIAEVMMLLGAPVIDITIGPPQVSLALDKAIARYRARSSNAVEDIHMFMTLESGKSVYKMPEEIVEVRKIWRRSIGAHTGTGVELDPFELAYSHMYVLQAGRFGGLTNYELFRQFQETAGRLFGSDINIRYHRPTRELHILRRVRSEESVLVEAYLEKSEGVLLEDVYARLWLQDWTVAQCKIMMGEIRGKYQNLTGPGGGTSLNAAELKLEGQQEQERLEEEITKFMEGGSPAAFIMA